MEKIFKKSLALVLSAALCLTALVGCLTVSAAETDNSATVTVGSVEVNSDATTAKVQVAIKASGDGIAAAMFELKVDTTKINLSGLWEDIATNIKTESDSIGINVSVSNDGDNVTTVASEDVYRFIVEGVDPTSGENVSIKQFTNASFDLTFNIASGVTGENAIEFVNDTHAQACNAGTFNIETGKFDGSDEALVPLTGTNGAVTIKAASTDAVLDDTITISTAINISETINTRIVVSKEIAKYADYELIVSRKKAYLIDASSGYGLTEVQNFVYGKDKAYTTTSDGRGVFLYNELGMYELGIDMSIMVKCYDENGNYVAYSNSATTNVGKLAYGLYSATNASAKNKNIAIDIAKLGDKAQAYMVNGKDCELATIVSPITYFPGDATEGAVFNVDNLDKTNIPESNVEGATVTPNVNLSSNPAIRFLAAGVGTYDVNDLRLVIDYTNAKNGSDCGVEIAGTDLLTAGSGTNTRYYTLFNKIALYDSNVPVKATIYSGTTKLASLEYSIEAYVNANWSNARMGEVLKAVANLGTSARAYFNM